MVQCWQFPKSQGLLLPFSHFGDWIIWKKCIYFISHFYASFNNKIYTFFQYLDFNQYNLHDADIDVGADTDEEFETVLWTGIKF